jgi:hypothetical protein
MFGAQSPEVSFQEQVDEPGRQHHRTVCHHVRLGQVPLSCGAYCRVATANCISIAQTAQEYCLGRRGELWVTD